jgi:hypothetical protein
MIEPPAVDPTENVKALNEAGSRRQDDLREAERRLVAAEIAHVKEIVTLHAAHQRVLAAAESARVNSIRQVDVLATAADRAQALTAIQTLAASQAASAETLRAAVSTTASTIASQLTTTVSEINKRISALEAAGYEGVGKQKVVDPQLTEALAEVRALRLTASSTIAKSEGVSWTVALIVAAVGLVATLLGIVGAVVALKPAATQTPIYVPSPSGTLLPNNPPTPAPR